MRQALYLLKFGCLHQHRDPISIPSYHYTMATRRYCEGFTWSCCLHKTIGQLLVSFVLSSWVEKCPIPPMIIRSNNDLTRCHYDGLTKGKIDTRSQHENEPSRGLRSIFLHAKDFAFPHEVVAEAWKIQPAVNNFLALKRISF